LERIAKANHPVKCLIKWKCPIKCHDLAIFDGGELS